MRLKGKVSIVTGGNSGIGFGIAQEFKNEGAVGSIFGRTKETLDESVAHLGSGFIGIQGDVTIMNDIERLYQETEDKFGKIDVLALNAGGAVGAGSIDSILNVTEESYDKMMDLNLKSTYFSILKSLPYLNDGASIILVASIAIHKGFPGMSIYSAAKAGVRSLARTISAELMDRNIRVNVLSPGTIETPLFGKLGFPEDVATQAKEDFVKLIPMKRIGTPKDMGTVASFLASSDSSFIVGEEIIADGGVVNL